MTYHYSVTYQGHTKQLDLVTPPDELRQKIAVLQELQLQHAVASLSVWFVDEQTKQLLFDAPISETNGINDDLMKKRYKNFGLVVVKRYQLYQMLVKQQKFQDVRTKGSVLYQDFLDIVQDLVRLAPETMWLLFNLRVIHRYSRVKCSTELHICERNYYRLYDQLLMYLGESLLRGLSNDEVARWEQEVQASTLAATR